MTFDHFVRSSQRILLKNYQRQNCVTTLNLKVAASTNRLSENQSNTPKLKIVARNEMRTFIKTTPVSSTENPLLLNNDGMSA